MSSFLWKYVVFWVQLNIFRFILSHLGWKLLKARHRYMYCFCGGDRVHNARFLAHLSQRLSWSFLIENCLVFLRPYVVNFSTSSSLKWFRYSRWLSLPMIGQIFFEFYSKTTSYEVNRLARNVPPHDLKKCC